MRTYVICVFASTIVTLETAVVCILHLMSDIAQLFSNILTHLYSFGLLYGWLFCQIMTHRPMINWHMTKVLFHCRFQHAVYFSADRCSPIPTLQQAVPDGYLAVQGSVINYNCIDGFISPTLSLLSTLCNGLYWTPGQLPACEGVHEFSVVILEFI